MAAIDRFLSIPLDFIAKLTAFVLNHRVNLIRFHGVFAPNSKYHAYVTPAKRGKGSQAQAQGDKTPEQYRQAMTWAQRLNLMSNHYHVVVEMVEGDLAKGMRQLNGIYTQYFNRTHQRVGQVFQGRYKGVLVEKDSYLKELSRCIELNPMRARMVKDANDWPWGSYLAITSNMDVPEWLETG